MTDMRFGWLGESRRTALHSLLLKVISDWSHDWWLNHSAAAVDVYPIDEWRLPMDAAEYLAVKGLGRMMLCPVQGKAGLGAHLAGNPGDEKGELAKKIGDEALIDLGNRIERRAGLVRMESWQVTEPPADMLKSYLGAYIATASLGEFAIDLAFDRAIADALVPPKPLGASSLVSRQAAMERSPIAVDIYLPLGVTKLSQLDDLRVGEILIGDATLADPIELRLGSHVLAIGSLRRMGHQRAAVITEEHPSQKKLS